MAQEPIAATHHRTRTGKRSGLASRSPGLWSLGLAAAAYCLPVAFILLPLASFLLTSFFHVRSGTILEELTVSNYVRFFVEGTFVAVLASTCFLCLGVTVLTLLFAYPVAFFISRLPGTTKYAVLLGAVVPMLMSYIVKIYAIRALLGGNGLLNRALLGLGLIDAPITLFVFNMNAILLTLTVLLIPFAVLPIFLSLERIPPSLLEASADLGASPALRFVTVTLPLTLPGIAAASSFVFILAIGDFLTPQMVGGQAGFTFGRVIYSQFGTAFNWPFGAALAVILSVVIILAVALASSIGRRGTGAA
jgi:spermidine/putrescine transport system permease protein